MSSESAAASLAMKPDDSRDRLAALLTAPQNTRFAQVVVNRFWQQLMGRGIVEPVEDWEKGRPSHPELLEWLSREFVRSGYSAKAIQRLILNSHAYQRQVDPMLAGQEPLFVSPAPRRLAAEQIVDSLFTATGKPFALEEMSLDVDGDRKADFALALGKPRRAWMLASTSNERDRPSSCCRAFRRWRMCWRSLAGGELAWTRSASGRPRPMCCNPRSSPTAPWEAG
ncbi:DUF1553 domain-containing protein [Verrucomicrobium spinosum]|uniref:DUF1553 domain-containing protein n=1 Tax=Verrucomicrobium spinosum TaxID=2736 RepID=UPI00210C5B8D|nr:DUF1553 domain-containing protein [Verrucomicrobium spinosum]